MTTVIGPHIIGPLSHMLDTLQQWQHRRYSASNVGGK